MPGYQISGVNTERSLAIGPGPYQAHARRPLSLATA
jgi:hypothetical protein